ncbi:DUF6607 family protein [Roseibacillus ishigakijimensis]|uniref:Secreted protein n=1 Tax=Roseibacillus ishigakijimensis TaxID=454146 RepID=A0A934RRM7_9BACT|nr:DUF6607 family protein [Roseibacillus ishigakijimensis]MBK1833769.1 hypothetical protein [Roseibacillus ishigakijimensis]
MQPVLLSGFLSLLATQVLFAESKFDQDRSAILGMAGTFAVTFHFEETIALQEGYELTKPYQTEAVELVKVVEDLGTSITLQHLLIVEDLDGPAVIKHWAQIWQYEDPHALTFEGDRTWLPVNFDKKEVKGTWTQFVTQIDDSPRYKAVGEWEHSGNYSAWTSQPSTRPLPRREYTKRDDYDRLLVTNQHLITPEGWVHLQHNRKQVRRAGRNETLCLESGTNTYRRITPEKDSDQALGVQKAEEYWEKTAPFWKVVRDHWAELLAESEGPVAYHNPKDQKPLMRRMAALAEEQTGADASLDPAAIHALIAEHLR